MLEKKFTEKMGSNCCCIASKNSESSSENSFIGDNNNNNKRKLRENEIDCINKSTKDKLGMDHAQNIESLNETVVINDIRDCDLMKDYDEGSNRSITCSCSIQNENRQSWSYNNTSKDMFL
jgi:hypothetical protein